MSRLLVLLTILLLATTANAASTKTPQELKDLYFGEALYWAFQEEWFDAIVRLDIELKQYRGLDQPELDPLYWHSHQAEFAVGDFELAYRMHQRAGRAISAVIEGNIDQPLRNEASYRLAKIYFQKDQPVDALHALGRIHGPVPEALSDDLAFLRAQVLMTNGLFAEAIEILSGLMNSDSLEGFTGYNLGMALLMDGREEDGRRQLEQTGQINTDRPETLSIRDKANLVLGEKLLNEESFAGAGQVFDRVRLDGPFSNRALLGTGWAAASEQRFERALVPWALLAEREITDPAVQEAMLAVPYSYGKLSVYSKAAQLYGQALETFGKEIDKLTASITSIREGGFLRAMIRQELKLDANWVIRLRELPDTPETFYLLDLLASHEFQESLKNYFDLEQLRKKLVTWKGDLNAFEEIIEKRSIYYQPQLPEIDRVFRALDSQMRLRLEQRERIQQRLQAMLVSPRPDFLATAEERLAKQALARLEQSLEAAGAEMSAEFGARLRRLRGLLAWNIHTDYDRRLTQAYKNLHDLDSVVEQLKHQYNTFVRVRQAATQSFQGYDATLHSLRLRIGAALEQVTTLMARQGHLLEVMAEKELVVRRERLEELQVKARFAMADSYDRATREQAAGEEEQ